MAHNLIITVDCGSTSHEALGVVEKTDCDAIIIDHHQLGEDFPPCYALINPNRPDDLSGQGDSGSSWCGVPDIGGCRQGAAQA